MLVCLFVFPEKEQLMTLGWLSLAKLICFLHLTPQGQGLSFHHSPHHSLLSLSPQQWKVFSTITCQNSFIVVSLIPKLLLQLYSKECLYSLAQYPRHLQAGFTLFSFYFLLFPTLCFSHIKLLLASKIWISQEFRLQGRPKPPGVESSFYLH